MIAHACLGGFMARPALYSLTYDGLRGCGTAAGAPMNPT